MKRLLTATLTAIPFMLIAACSSGEKDRQALLARIDSLQEKADAAYVPGTGEIMNSIVQPHHLKLWLAGTNNNWTLAAYELHLLSGGFKRVEKFHKGSPEATAVQMIYPELDSLNDAIKAQRKELFQKHFLLMTNTCNSCHQATNNPFVVIKVPEKELFSNQEF
ncbi:hypothetical protein [Chitinophaga filiformis]|uniref:Cytochrome C n=1 Tax=Chitinophaga filiformis TaxID=104663 RepID=A0ABY4HU70_CHIFI|nr:hypothetical protein [Chitinophaga filiformis]UPK66554.1 hypothetical protein MYF79_16570 [Chitinophaga filiformis]